MQQQLDVHVKAIRRQTYNNSYITAWSLHTMSELHCVSKNNTDVADYNFNADQPILIIFGKDVAKRVCYQTVICYPTSPN